jgi:hypothetical protein
MKIAKIYFKPEIQCTRHELVLGSRFLRHYKIESPFDFGRLAEILPSHISFHTFNQQKLVRRMNTMGISAKRQREILRFVASLAGDIWPTLNYLRQEAGMANTRRLLDEHPMNKQALNALKVWAKQWPTASTRLIAKK